VGVVIVGLVVFGALAVLLVVIGVPWFFNRLSPSIDARRRARDDDYFLTECSSGRMSKYRWFNGRVPSDPRCRLCLVPFGGVGRMLRVRPSRKNPNYCMGCFEMAPLGTQDMEVGVLFADLRNFTSWCEHRSPEAVEQMLSRFYAVASQSITRVDGLVDKLVGDEVMGLFLPTFPTLGDRTCDVMVRVATEIIEQLDAAANGEDAPPVGVGLHYGVARVGNVGAGNIKDFTAVGDVVNTAARLQGCAQPRQIVLSASVHDRVLEQPAGALPVHLEVKGKADAVDAWVVAAT
jgi:adenylate cyclase